jgi:ParB-like nuclease domain
MTDTAETLDGPTTRDAASDDYGRLAPSAIYVSAERQRRDVDLDEGFLASLRARGILTPLLVKRDGSLVAGGRRHAAAVALGLPTVPVRYVSGDLDEATVELIELEENTRRKNLPWQDEARAIERLHRLYVARDGAWSMKKTSEVLAVGPVHLWLRVARALGDASEAAKIANAAGMRAAYNICERIDGRATDAVMEEIASFGSAAYAGGGAAGGGSGCGSDDAAPCDDNSTASVDESPVEGEGARGGSPSGLGSTTARVGSRLAPSPPGAGPAHPPASDVLCVDFIQWASRYTGPRFNFIHCDFPYGKRTFGGEWGGARAEDEFKYEDEGEVYWALCEALCEHLERLVTDTAHLMFWTSGDLGNLHATVEFFRSRAPSLIFQPRTLVWHKSDNVGITSDPKRGPRWTYEVALMATRGDRALVRPLAASYSAPTARALHPSAKPEPVLRHFFGMFVDTTSRVLDPTCGSGSALRAAESLGAAAVVGVEKSSDFAATAQKALREFRTLRELTR